MAEERPSGLRQRSFLLGSDEIDWLKNASNKTKLTQGDLVRLAVHRLKKDLGAANRLKRDDVVEHAKGTKWAAAKRGGPRRRAAK